MKCLYIGCKTNEESPDNTFHKVVGSCGRDGNPLYICSEHFEKLKSSKTPSLVSCKQIVVRPAASAKKKNIQEETVNNEEKKRDNFGPKKLIQAENRNNVEGNKDVVGKKKDDLELKIATIDPIHGTRGEKEPVKEKQVESEPKEFNQGENEVNIEGKKIVREKKKDVPQLDTFHSQKNTQEAVNNEEQKRVNFEPKKVIQVENRNTLESNKYVIGKKKDSLELKSATIDPSHGTSQSTSLQSIIRGEIELVKEKQVESEPKKFNQEENEDSIEGKKVVRKKKKDTFTVGRPHGPHESVSLPSVFQRKRELEGVKGKGHGPQQYTNRDSIAIVKGYNVIDVEKNNESVLKPKTVKTCATLGPCHSVSFPSILRRKREQKKGGEEHNEPTKRYKKENTDTFVGSKVVEGTNKSIIGRKTVRIGSTSGMWQSKSRPSILRTEKELKEDKRYVPARSTEPVRDLTSQSYQPIRSGMVSYERFGTACPNVPKEVEAELSEHSDGENKNYFVRHDVIVVAENEKFVPKPKTVRVGHTHGSLPSIIRRKKERRKDELEQIGAENNHERGYEEKKGNHEVVLKECNQEESKVQKDIQEGNAAKEPSQEENKLEEDIHEANNHSKRETEVKESNQEEFEANEHNNGETCLTNRQFIRVNDMNLPLRLRQPPPVESNKHNQQGTARQSYTYLHKFRIELFHGGVGAIECRTLHALPPPHQSLLEGGQQNKKLSEDERELKKPSQPENEARKLSLGGNEAIKFNLEVKHSLVDDEADIHNLEENDLEKSSPENEPNKQSPRGNKAFKPNHEVNKHSLEEIETKKQSLEENEVEKPRVEGSDPGKHNLDEYEVKKVSVQENESKKISQEEDKGNVGLEKKTHENFPRHIQHRRCSAVRCEVGTKSHPNVKLFRFPPQFNERNEIWCQIAYRMGDDGTGDFEGSRTGYLCARHFQPLDFTRCDKQKLNMGATPSYYTGPLNPITQDYSPFEDSDGPKEAVYCSAVNCGLSQKTHPDVAFTPFPSRGDSRYQEWLAIAGGVRNPRYLCSRHFDETQFSDDGRTVIKLRAVPKYKSGPLNPQTNDYAPFAQDGSEESPISSTTAVSAVSPVSQNIGVSSASPLDGQNIRISAASPMDVQNLKIASASSLFGQKVKLAAEGSVLSKNIAVIASPTGAGQTVKMPAKPFAGKPGLTCSSKTGEPPDNDEDEEMDAIYRRCDAVNCPSSYKNDPKVKYFTVPGKANASNAAEKKRRHHWIDVVGGTKDSRARFLCQYHFAADAFVDKTRTALVRKANPLFPYGPLNPVTKDYCPIGEEQRSLSSRDFLRARCCVDACTTYSYNTTGLFGFPMHDREAYDEWTKRVGVFKYFTEQHIRTKFRICPKHFSNCCTVTDKEKNTIQLKFGALPTIAVPCFKGPPSEKNSFVQDRTLSRDEIEALKMLSEADRVCDLNDICDKENDELTSQELKRKITDAKAVPKKKSKDDPVASDSSKQLVLLPIQDENGQQTYVLADFGTNEDFASISGQTQNFAPQASTEIKPLSGVREPMAGATPVAVEKVADKQALSKVMNTHVCTYWSPDEFNDRDTVAKKAREANKERKAQLGKIKVQAVTHKNILGWSKEKSAKQMYEDFSVGIQEDNIGNEVDINIEEPSAQPIDNVKMPALPTEKTDSTETALLKIFGSCEASDDNVFSCFIDSSKVPDHDEENNVHSYCSSNSLNVIRSAAELCEFNDLKMKQLERLIGIGEDTSSELEQILIKHLSSVMCITGVDFLKKCFDHVLKEAITKKKEKDKIRRYSHNKSKFVEKYSDDTKKLAVALQTFSGKAYHAMTQLIDLPYQSVTRQWTCHKNGDPGFSDRAFKVLVEEVTKKKGLTVSLGMEEVPLKQDVSWDGKRTFGHTDLGYGSIDYDYIPEATRAVVFFAIALNRTWRIPLGYCLADNLSASVRANLVMQYLYKLSEAGVKCVALVCNYSLATYQMLIELGAISEEYYAPLTGSFPHPSAKGERVHCFIDIHQLIKSINTLWAEKKVFTFKNNDEIEWSHMNRMNEFIQSENKVPNPGLETVYNDLLSLKSLIKRDPRSSYKYNALVLALLKNLGLEGFENVTGTAVFLDKLNYISEVFSSCHSFDPGEMQALSKGNLAEVTLKLNSVIAYFNNLTYSDGTKIMTSQRKLPLVLLFSNITSLKTMIKKVLSVDKFKLDKIKTASLNLDSVHQILLEMTDGEDRLLNPLEFKKAFFKYMENLSLEPSSSIKVLQKTEESAPHPVENCLGFSNSFSYLFSPVSTVCESVHEFFTENVIENWLKVAHCTDCSQLIQKELLKYGNHDSKGNVIEDIHRMLRMAETILAELAEIPIDAFKSWFDKLANKTLNSLTSLKGFKNNSHLFNSKPFGEVTHFTVMVKDMLRIFLRLRVCFLSRQEKIRIKPPRQYSLRFCLGRSWA